MAGARPRRARARGGAKPRDVGTGLVCASLTRDGWWLSLATVEPAHGVVELTGMPPFDERLRGDPAAVRRYRALMADRASAFLALEPSMAGSLDAQVAPPVAGGRLIGQQLTLRRRSGEDGPVGLVLRFRGTLVSPALAMITESRGWPSAQQRGTRLAADGAALRIAADGLTTTLAIEVEGAPAGAAWQLNAEEGAVLELRLPRGADELRATLRCGLVEGGGSPVAVRRRRGVAAAVASPADERLWLPADLWPALERIRRRALRYVRECTALRVAADRVVLLTDHRLLPLSWTRDAYYQAQVLLSAGEHELVADHLRWLWLACDRPAATWARSHHADGRRHDEVYQADQQLYPLLELADYRRQVGQWPALGGGRAADDAAWLRMVARVLDDLERRLAGAGLLPSDENAADDPLGLPFVLANQLLAWHTFDRLTAWPELDGRAASPAALARALRAAIERHFRGATRDSPWHYAVDGRGAKTLYHDANDVAMALAPLWGFCRADDAGWLATVDFAFGPPNAAWSAGRWGGLGSGHTPGVWSLGLIQEWVARSLTGECAAAESALHRLVAVSFADGMLPEASDPRTGRAWARHWFAWPGALVGALVGGRPPDAPD